MTKELERFSNIPDIYGREAIQHWKEMLMHIEEQQIQILLNRGNSQSDNFIVLLKKYRKIKGYIENLEQIEEEKEIAMTEERELKGKITRALLREQFPYLTERVTMHEYPICKHVLVSEYDFATNKYISSTDFFQLHKEVSVYFLTYFQNDFRAEGPRWGGRICVQILHYAPRLCIFNDYYQSEIEVLEQLSTHLTKHATQILSDMGEEYTYMESFVESVSTPKSNKNDQ